jgi:U4/U6 small nuclear ribonucleoprotein PRP31
VLYQCDLVQGCPHSIRRKILSVLANKVVLLARVDSYASKQDKNSVSQGMKIRQELEEKIEKLLEPPKARTKKALPVPEEKKRTSRRGGKRVRRMKERYAMTELRSQQNKLSFSMNEGEYGDSAMGLDMGMIGHKDSGKIRATVKKEVSLLKKQRKDGSATRGVGLGTNSVINGLSSSLSFTPIQGIELVNPTANLDKVKAANAKWFSSNSGFLSAVPK